MPSLPGVLNRIGEVGIGIILGNPSRLSTNDLRLTGGSENIIWVSIDIAMNRNISHSDHIHEINDETDDISALSVGLVQWAIFHIVVVQFFLLFRHLNTIIFNRISHL